MAGGVNGSESVGECGAVISRASCSDDVGSAGELKATVDDDRPTTTTRQTNEATDCHSPIIAIIIMRGMCI